MVSRRLYEARLLPWIILKDGNEAPSDKKIAQAHRIDPAAEDCQTDWVVNTGDRDA